MTPRVSFDPRAVAAKARDAVARIRPGATEGRRSLPIRGSADDIRRLWDEPGARAAVLDDLPVAESRLEIGSEVPGWGTTATVTLRLESAVPGMATQILAGKAVRRLKALVETGEVPTTEANPAAREEAS